MDAGGAATSSPDLAPGKAPGHDGGGLGGARVRPLTEAYFVSRTLRLLELVAFGGRSTAEVASELQIHPRTARRMLQRLCDERYVVREDGPHGRYELTMHLPALGAQAAVHARLPQLAAPVLERLHSHTGLTAHLFVPCYDAVLCVAHRASGMSVECRAGELLPCHCSAAGKVLLAERSAWAAGHLARALPRLTERTVTDASALREQLASIRDAGFAVEDGEHQRSSRAVAAPVHAARERAVAAIAVSVGEPVDAVTASVHVVSAARDLGAALGAPRADCIAAGTRLHVS